MASYPSEQITEYSDFTDSPEGAHKYWSAELTASFKATRKWHDRGNHVVMRYNDQRGADEISDFHLNLFYANITTTSAMLFGKVPEIVLDRRNNDYNDDVARVASVILQRCLQNDIGTPNDQYSDSLRKNLQDRLIPGLGVSRVRYEFDEQTTQTAAIESLEGVVQAEGFEKTEVTDERAPIEYVHWRDFAWSPARTWEEVRWVGFRVQMTKEQLKERFGEELANQIPLTMSAQVDAYDQDDYSPEADSPKQDAWRRAEIWEIWDKSDKKITWWCKSYPKILDERDDPLGLTGFFPVPVPMTSNVTTTAYMPIPDFTMAQDLYNEIDTVESRMARITAAVKVVGVYDKSSEGVKRMLSEGIENDLIPVDNWAMFAEKGGLNGMVDWLPIEVIAGVLRELTARRNDLKQQLFEITGMSDIMRGAQAAGGAVTATERSLEARFASVRIQALQDQFAMYATDLIRLRAEIIAKHFSPESIIKQSNIQSTADGQNQELVQAAIQLIKTRPDFIWRVKVKPESVAMVDYAQLKQERTDYLTAVATFLQSSAPLIDMMPAAAPLLMQLMKWGLAGFKGGNEIEGIIDQALDQAGQEQEQGGEEQDPEAAKAAAEQQKMQMQMQAEREKVQGQIALEQQKHQDRMEQIQSEAAARQQELQMETQQDIIKEQAQKEANMEEETHETAEFIKREQARARINPVSTAE